MGDLRWDPGIGASLQAYESAFEAALRADVQSVCAPLLGAGAKQFPPELAAGCAVQAALRYGRLELCFADLRPECVEELRRQARSSPGCLCVLRLSRRVMEGILMDFGWPHSTLPAIKAS